MEAGDWISLSDQELLERRISALGLRLEGTPFEPLIQQLYAELTAHGLVFHPPCHVGDEWFVPIGIPAIFIPFFLVHDRLRALERTMILQRPSRSGLRPGSIGASFTRAGGRSKNWNTSMS